MRLSRIIIFITLPIFLLMLFASILTTKQYLLVSEGLYDSHEEITFDHEEVSDRVMGYLNYRYDTLQVFEDGEPVFRQIELDHMEDVKNLYSALRLVALGALVVAVSLSVFQYKKDRVYLLNTYKNMYQGPFVFIFVLGGYILIDFGAAFTAFHKLFFNNNDWQLRWDDALIQLLPFTFWMVSAIIILVLFALSLALIHFIAKKKISSSYT